MNSYTERKAVSRLAELVQLDERSRSRLERGTSNQIYGPYVDRMASHAIGLIQEGLIDPTTTISALEIASSLYAAAERNHNQNPNPLAGEALRAHQENVLRGDIRLVPSSSATTKGEGVAQVIFANDMLKAANPKVQAALSAINYGSLFRNQTMAGATRTLDRSEINALLESMKSTQEAMPHLSVSNWAIGQTVAEIYRSVADSGSDKRIRVIDIGSGHGSTIAAITNSLVHVDDINRRPELALTALETTPEFYKELTTFAENDAASSALGLERVRLDSASEEPVSTFGTLTTVNTDAVSALNSADMSEWNNDNDVTVVTANYSFHRLPQTSKDAIIERFSKLPNVIFVIGDLAQNTSIINSRYFNLAANGPLNPGNRNLARRLTKEGFDIVDLDKEKPEGMDPRIAKRLSEDHKNNDGHLWIAYKGTHAKNALHLMPSAA